MRKYVKPVLFYEHYELSQHIADCAWEPKYPDGEKTVTANGECVAYGDADLGYAGKVLFKNEGMDCNLTTDDNSWEDYCYQPGADAIKVAFS